MFDISFMEMLIVAIAALVVLGPERLPTVARQAGQWMSRMRRYIEDVKSDFSHQIDLAELKGIKNEVEDSARSLERGLNDARSSFDTLQSSFDTSTAESLPVPRGTARPMDTSDRWSTVVPARLGRAPRRWPWIMTRPTVRAGPTRACPTTPWPLRPSACRPPTGTRCTKTVAHASD
ncbi:Sec-independent protein translocase protein TatB [Lautropia mirabilis]